MDVNRRLKIQFLVLTNSRLISIVSHRERELVCIVLCENVGLLLIEKF